MKKRIIIHSLALLLLLAVIYIYYNFNPSNSGWTYQCQFHHLTGLECPGCGGQRALHALLHGHILEAMRYNVLYTIGMPFIIYLYFFCVEVYIIRNKTLLNNFLFTPRTGIILAIVVAVFFFLRNIPVFPFTYLSPP